MKKSRAVFNINIILQIIVNVCYDVLILTKQSNIIVF